MWRPDQTFLRSLDWISRANHGNPDRGGDVERLEPGARRGSASCGAR
jgi:hypothetical protein